MAARSQVAARSNVIALEAHSRAAARAARLRYVDDSQAGFSRKRQRSTFAYFDAKGRRLRESEMLARVRALAIPPAWTEVWICRHDDGHIQATGRDARGRKQYRYHRLWSQARDAAKHARMCDFAGRLAMVRAHCRQVLDQPGFDRDKIVCALLCIVDLTAIRVGHEEYARDNASFGLTTLRKRHVRSSGARVELSFRGKSGIARRLSFHDRAIAGVITRCRGLAGTQLFQYCDAHGKICRVTADHLNSYLRGLVGPEHSVKDFRTWAATVRVAVELRQAGPAATQRAVKQQLLAAIGAAAEQLGNTPAVCRKSYVHPLIMDAYQHGMVLPRARSVDASGDFRAHELAVRRFLLRLIRESSRRGPREAFGVATKPTPLRPGLKRAS
jgi:DNA topoisomerase-1